MAYSELIKNFEKIRTYTVARILSAAAEPGATEKELQQIVLDHAFSESTLTLLEKRWLKALLEDPRVKLFGISLPELAEVKPLFTRAGYRIMDQYNDGDPYEARATSAVFRPFCRPSVPKARWWSPCRACGGSVCGCGSIL